MTAIEHSVEVVYHPVTVRTVEVRRVERLSPRMARVTFGGTELDGFVDASPGDHVKVFFPEPGANLPVLPGVEPDGDGIIMPTEPPFPTSRDYTTRRFDPATGELDLDFVLHGNGVASTWAEQAEPGQVVGLAGPRGSIFVSWDFDWYLFAGDETAQPAIERHLEQLPPGVPVIAFLLVDGPEEEHDIDTATDLRLTWLHRRGSDDPQALLDRAIQGLEFPAGEPFVWIAGEAGELRPIRRYLRGLGLNREYTDVDGFWKRGVVNLDHHEPDEDDD